MGGGVQVQLSWEDGTDCFNENWKQRQPSGSGGFSFVQNILRAMLALVTVLLYIMEELDFGNRIEPSISEVI